MTVDGRKLHARLNLRWFLRRETNKNSRPGGAVSKTEYLTLLYIHSNATTMSISILTNKIII